MGHTLQTHTGEEEEEAWTSIQCIADLKRKEKREERGFRFMAQWTDPYTDGRNAVSRKREREEKEKWPFLFRKEISEKRKQYFFL